MSAPQVPAPAATATQLLEALDKYDAGTCGMVESWPDIALYRSVSAQLEEIRILSASLPRVRAQWTALLVAHAETIHMLWRMQHGHQPSAREQMAGVRQHHSDCIAALRHRCEHLLASRTTPPTLETGR